MKTLARLLPLLVFCSIALAARAPLTFDGEFTMRKLRGGRGIFDFSMQQNGNSLKVGFNAAYSDGRGAAPEATGAGKINGNTAQFSWKDSFGNVGDGTIELAGANEIIVSLKPTRVADARCLVFYRDRMKLKRIKV